MRAPRKEGSARRRGSRAARRGAAPPATFTPQLATLVKTAPAGDEWFHEIKLDGYRIGARMADGKVKLLSRNGQDWTARFAPIEAAVASLPLESALIDGEVAVVLPDGRTSFQALQNTFAGGQIAADLVYFVFDLLHVDGEDITELPLEERKQRLEAIVRRPKRAARIRFVDHVVGQGGPFLEQACHHGLEGIVSKRRELPYRAGRGPGWVKTKCIKRQEFVVGGFTDPEGARSGIGALLIGVYDQPGKLVFAGKVGTGFTQASARTVRDQLDRLEQRECPFAERPPARAGRAHWVRPDLVAEVAFTEWTDDGKIRHPSFQGLRADKAATEIVREVATAAPSKPVAKQSTHADRSVVAGVTLSHPERVLYPEIGVTKLELAHFYEQIADSILPHLKGRPLTLVRCPNGIGASCFFMKHSGKWTPAGVRTVPIREKEKTGQYLVADNLTALISLVQANVLELHTWNASVDRVEQPNQVVLDLDPGPAVDWPAIVDAARLVRATLAALELVSFVKTTGGHGLHVVVPLIPEAQWEVGLSFARAVADAMARLSPRLYTTNFAKAGRERKILIDYMRNNRLSTSVAAFSTRARPGAPVSTPLSWAELEKRVTSSDQFTVRNLAQRLKRMRADPWKEYWTVRQRIPADAVERLAAVGA